MIAGATWSLLIIHKQGYQDISVFNLSGREYIEFAFQAQKTQLDLDRDERTLGTPKAIGGVGNHGTVCHVSSGVIGAVAEGELWA